MKSVLQRKQVGRNNLTERIGKRYGMKGINWFGHLRATVWSVSVNTLQRQKLKKELYGEE